MQIRFLSRLFQTTKEPESKPTTSDSITKPVQPKISEAQDSFEAAPQRGSYFSGKYLSQTDLQQEQNYSRDQNSESLVKFDAGEIRNAYVIGNLWDSKDTPTAIKKKDSDSDDD